MARIGGSMERPLCVDDRVDSHRWETCDKKRGKIYGTVVTRNIRY